MNMKLEEIKSLLNSGKTEWHPDTILELVAEVERLDLEIKSLTDRGMKNPYETIKKLTSANKILRDKIKEVRSVEIEDWIFDDLGQALTEADEATK